MDTNKIISAISSKIGANAINADGVTEWIIDAGNDVSASMMINFLPDGGALIATLCCRKDDECHKHWIEQLVKAKPGDEFISAFISWQQLKAAVAKDQAFIATRHSVRTLVDGPRN